MGDKRIRVGIAGTFQPPFENLVRNAKRNEEQGYDTITFPDHLMGWTPQSIWTPDISPFAAKQKNSDSFFDCVSCLAAAAMVTERVKLASSVTEPVRRHPAMIAQEFVTLDHIAKGRIILGIGTGEGENIIPYGLDFSKPATRLEEAIRIIRLLWESDGRPVSFEGKFWRLDRAIFGLEPYDGRFPPIWVAAHGPRMLEIAGTYGDGWYPTRMSAADYAQKLGVIKRVGEKNGRDMSGFTASMYAYGVFDTSHEECHRMLEAPLVKAYCLIVPPEVYASVGAEHPFSGSYGLLDFIPSHLSRETVLDALAKTPPTVAEHYILHGTPEEVAEEISRLGEAGLEHVVLENLTFLGDPSKVRSSYACLEEIRRLLS